MRNTEVLQVAMSTEKLKASTVHYIFTRSHLEDLYFYNMKYIISLRW